MSTFSKILESSIELQRVKEKVLDKPGHNIWNFIMF